MTAVIGSHQLDIIRIIPSESPIQSTRPVSCGPLVL